MKITDLHHEIQTELNRVMDLDSSVDQGRVLLSSQQYDKLFWQLFYKQLELKRKGSDVNLVEQLNRFVSHHRSNYPASFSIRAPVKLKRPSPPVTQNSLEDIKIIERLDNFFVTSLAVPHEDIQFILGRLLYSAMRFGGLLRNDYLNSLLIHLRIGKPMSYQTQIWYELSGNAGETHIWQPDSITLQLIYQWEAKYKAHTDFDVFKCFQKFAKNAGLTTLHKFRFKRLVQAILSLLSLQISPYLLNILSGRQPNITLKKDVFYRLISKKPTFLDISNPITDEDERTIVSVLTPSEYNPDAFFYDERKANQCRKEVKFLLNSISKASSDKKQGNESSRSEVARKIAEKVEGADFLPAVMHHLFHWVCVRLTSQSRWSGKLGANTLITYLDSIVNPMMRVFALKDPVKLSPEDLAELYTEVIDDGVSLISQTKRARILRDFHIYLELTHQVSPCYLFQQYIAKSKRLEALTVDANILMPWEYRQAFDYLLQSNEQQSGLTSLQAKAVLVLLILGFRCGLRRREAYLLRVQDIEIIKSRDQSTLPQSATIYITPHALRSLKSLSAERRIPIGLLLNDEEKSIFLAFYNERLKFGVEFSPYFFYFTDDKFLNNNERPLIPDDYLFGSLKSLLQQVTGDRSFRFHHLRHSFATWMFWNWQKKTCDKTRLPIESLQETPEFSHLKIAKAKLLHVKDGQPTRIILHTISALIGHSSPSMTLFHYIHSASWLGWMELNSNAPDLSREVEAYLSGVNVRTATRARVKPAPTFQAYAAMAGYSAKKLLNYCSELQLIESDVSNRNRIISIKNNVQEQVVEIDIYSALIRNINFGIPAEICAQDANISLDALNQAIKNGMYFLSTKFNDASKFEHKKRPRNHVRISYQNGSKVKIEPLAQLPSLPRSIKSLEMAKKMLKEFKMLEKEQQTEILWASHYAVNSCSVYWSNFRFYNTDSLHRFLHAISWFKKAFNVSRRLRFTLVSRATINSELRESQWKSWLSDDWQEQFRENRANNEYSVKSYMAVDFMAKRGELLARDLKRISRGKRTVNYNRRPSEYGIRFGLYLLFLCFYKQDIC